MIYFNQISGRIRPLAGMGESGRVCLKMSAPFDGCRRARRVRHVMRGDQYSFRYTRGLSPYSIMAGRPLLRMLRRPAWITSSL